jgi:hypothetical protein
MAKKTASKTAPRTLVSVPAPVVEETVEETPTAPPVWASNVPSVDITLEDIVRQCPTENDFVYTPETVHIPLEARKLVEYSTALVNEHGWLGTRPTQKGRMEAMQNVPASAPAPVSEYRPTYDASNDEPAISVSDDDGGFEIENSIPPPQQDGRSGKRHAVKYPFDKLQVGQSFFVPNTPEKPEMAKALASTVSAATARWDEVIPEKVRVNRKGVTVAATRRTRKFVIGAVDGGARIWRTM